MSETAAQSLLSISLQPPHLASLQWRGDKETWDLIRLLIRGHGSTLQERGAQRILLPWSELVGLAPQLQGLRATHPFETNYSQDALEMLREASRRRLAFREAGRSQPLDTAVLQEQLARQGFARPLSSFQLRNVSRLANLPAAATFSVPGAGKTTEALAYLFARRMADEPLVVIAPKNAFGAWEEQLADCAPAEPAFVRLSGGADRIRILLEGLPKYAIITYQQLPYVKDVLADYLALRPSFLFLDESHRIKSGRNGVIAQAVLDLASLPVGKLIMTGTPMPQSESDLEPQFSFLYPEVRQPETPPSELVAPIYVRTTKDELGLRPVERRVYRLEMHPLQSRVYELIRSEEARRLLGVNLATRGALRTMGRAVVRLLQFASNPALLAGQLEETAQVLLAGVIQEGDSPKLEWACKRARELARTGRKTIIWSSFVSNVELISGRLADIGADFIHGQVGTGDEENEDTREGKIKRFHDDPAAMVLVANPAAASEGISLHTVCHHAIYVDRTFNVAHYMQSEDRIHRFGLPAEQRTIVEVLESAGTIDEVVRIRLGEKVERMAEALRDPAIRVDPVPYDSPYSDEADEPVLSADDVDVILGHLRDG